MAVVPIDFDAVTEALKRNARLFSDQLRSAPDPGASVPRLKWTINDVAMHVAEVTRRYEGFTHGTNPAFPEDMAAFNELQMAELRPKTLVELADMVEETTTAFVSSIPSSETPMDLYDIPADGGSVAAVLLGELSIHAIDVARALGRRSKLSRGDALLITYGALAAIPSLVDPDTARGFRCTYEVRLRGGETISLAFDDGTLRIARGPAARADCRISADPAAFLLVGYGRQSLMKTALLGRSIALGRKPWLAFRFNSLLRPV